MSPDGSSETPSERYYQGDHSMCILTTSMHVWHVENLKNNVLLFLFENILSNAVPPQPGLRGAT